MSRMTTAVQSSPFAMIGGGYWSIATKLPSKKDLSSLPKSSLIIRGYLAREVADEFFVGNAEIEQLECILKFEQILLVPDIALPDHIVEVLHEQHHRVEEQGNLEEVLESHGIVR